jgi:hypothetical protein
MNAVEVKILKFSEGWYCSKLRNLAKWFLNNASITVKNDSIYAYCPILSNAIYGIIYYDLRTAVPQNRRSSKKCFSSKIGSYARAPRQC